MEKFADRTVIKKPHEEVEKLRQSYKKTSLTPFFHPHSIASYFLMVPSDPGAS